MTRGTRASCLAVVTIALADGCARRSAVSIDQATVRISASDSSVYRVYRDGAALGTTPTSHKQHLGTARTYDVELAGNRRVCSLKVAAEHSYEDICLVCDTKTGKMSRATCR
jgi:hypothetical protein